MKVLLTATDPGETIKMDIPIIPEKGSKFYLSPDDEKKISDFMISHIQETDILDIGIDAQEFLNNVIMEFLTVRSVDICWDEEENTYLPLIFLYPDEDEFESTIKDLKKEYKKEQKKAKNKLSN